MNVIQSKALIGIGSIGEVPVLLAKPQTYMNFSGESVGPLAAYYKVPLHHILLVYDEMSLPNGVLRLQHKGGHGHHNGLKDVMGHLDGSREFPRLAIGIGNPPGTMDVKTFLLQKFSSVERKQIDESLEQGVEALHNPHSRLKLTAVSNFVSSPLLRSSLRRRCLRSLSSPPLPPPPPTSSDQELSSWDGGSSIFSIFILRALEYGRGNRKLEKQFHLSNTPKESTTAELSIVSCIDKPKC
ncbi:hypothetical protein RIF29_14004 [Crotalaria pallida]|uniref:Peptidyl-tRNA hydrolase n=1 Tax=Crotalaria pallida TaxID=3830 RepID=A0AAN9FCJ7_CROPI